MDAVMLAIEASCMTAEALGPHLDRDGQCNELRDLHARAQLLGKLIHHAAAPGHTGNRANHACAAVCEVLARTLDVVRERLAAGGGMHGAGGEFLCGADDRAAFAECSEAAHQCSRELVASLVSTGALDVPALQAALMGAASADGEAAASGAGAAASSSSGLDRVARQALAGAVAGARDQAASSVSCADAGETSRLALAGVPRVSWEDLVWPDGMSPTPEDPGRHLIARGGFGTVYQALLVGLGSVAVKVLDMEGRIPAKRLKQVGSECRSQLRASSHPHVASFVGLALDDATGRMALVSHLAEGGSLYDAMMEEPTDAWARLSPVSKLRSLLGPVSAVAHMHSIGVVHGDVKPGNVLLARPVEGDKAPECWVCDFGLARTVGAVRSSVRRSVMTSGVAAEGGTVRYMAPETSVRNEVVPGSDVFSLGLVLWSGLTGEEAFEGVWDAAAYAALVGERGLRPDLTMLPAGCPAGLSGVLGRCWCADPSARPTCAELVDELTAMIMALEPAVAVRLAGAGMLENQPLPPPLQTDMLTNDAVAARYTAAAAEAAVGSSIAQRGFGVGEPVLHATDASGGAVQPGHDGVVELVGLLSSTREADVDRALATMRELGGEGDSASLQAMADAEAVRLLVRLLSSTHIQKAQHAAAALYNMMVDSEAARRAVADAGAVGPLVRLLSSTEARTVEHAVSALRNMTAGSEAVTRAVADGGAIGPLARLLSSTEARTVEQAVSALHNMTAGSEAVTRAVADGGAIGPLVQLLSSGRGEAVSSAAMALHCVSTAQHDRRQRGRQARRG